MFPLLTSADPDQLAARARSALSCPAAASMVIKGTEHLFGGDDLGLQDRAGVPTLVCRTGSVVEQAGRARQKALLRIISGVVEEDGTTESVVLAGKLGTPRPCCDPSMSAVAIEPTIIMLIRTQADGSTRQYRVPTALFTSPAHALNQGYLRRCTEHLNECHDAELRQAVSLCTATPGPRLIGAALHDLSPTGVEVRWVDVDGAHLRRVDFDAPAATPDELAAALRDHLHAGLC
ncbi:hypothetical protein [Nocardioides zeae]|uniref:DUF2470 domain-containing protein n=1 Tax=Nocardioides zeae TaxID=1457234 RepID=A0A6P0HEV7_9ACTN|nr:hypothetical protein [Nocardioides zeae]NEN76837.1 hypothetical protein [Nocardioides zeae]